MIIVNISYIKDNSDMLEEFNLDYKFKSCHVLLVLKRTGFYIFPIIIRLIFIIILIEKLMHFDNFFLYRNSQIKKCRSIISKRRQS